MIDNNIEITAVNTHNRVPPPPQILQTHYIGIITSYLQQISSVREFLCLLNTSPSILYVPRKHGKRFSRKTIGNMQQPVKHLIVLTLPGRFMKTKLYS